MAIEGSTCEGRLGFPGSGKSLDQTLLPILEHLLAGEEVYCNYFLNWNKPNLHYWPPSVDGWLSIKDKRNCVVVMDEICYIFDSRNWEQESQEFRRWLQLHRHNHVDIYFNTQDISFVAKSIGVLTETWILCEKVKYGPIMEWIFKKLGLWPRISIDKTYLTVQQLKKMANGWELDGMLEHEDIDSERKHYNNKELLMKDLDEYKIELIHRYCPKCASRQGEQILKEDTEKIATYNVKTKSWDINQEEYCPKHKEQKLEIRESGLYDTDYIPEETEAPYKMFRAIKPCPDCGKDTIGMKAPTYSLQEMANFCEKHKH